MAKNLAIFDYDNTLIRGDSLWPYLCFASGRVRATLILARACCAYALRRLRGPLQQGPRTFIKACLLRRLLAGKRIDRLGEAARRTRRWQRVDDDVMQKLHAHRAKGDTILIASGALDLYLPELLRTVPYDGLLCTDIGVQDGVVTGDMPRGNCVRATKARRVAAWLAAHGPFADITAYGNYPHDAPMLELARYRIIVS